MAVGGGKGVEVGRGVGVISGVFVGTRVGEGGSSACELHAESVKSAAMSMLRIVIRMAISYNGSGSRWEVLLLVPSER